MISVNDELSMPQSIQGVIFDLDGTLVDSRLDFPAMRREIGLPPNTPVLEGALALTGERASRAWSIIERHERQGADTATVVPGIHDVLDELHQRDIRVAVVTRNGRTFAQTTLDRLQLPIDLMLTRDDAPPKPSPAALLKILDSWQMPARRAAMIGDFRFDLEAGRAAGTRTVLYSAHCAAEELAQWRSLADFVVPSFVDHLPLLAWLGRPLPMETA
jgi:HAD superfamily hydrolase (TIGR01549 family)